MGIMSGRSDSSESLNDYLGNLGEPPIRKERVVTGKYITPFNTPTKVGINITIFDGEISYYADGHTLTSGGGYPFEEEILFEKERGIWVFDISRRRFDADNKYIVNEAMKTIEYFSHEINHNKDLLKEEKENIWVLLKNTFDSIKDTPIGCRIICKDGIRYAQLPTHEVKSKLGIEKKEL